MNNFLENINKCSLAYNFTVEFVNEKHIKKGWLKWINEPDLVLNTSMQKREYTSADLVNYLQQQKSICFLACYQKKCYFGNVRIYELKNKIASFGRLIGHRSAKNKGLGKKMSLLAQNIIFDLLDYDTIIVGNTSKNIASSISKLKTGFRKMQKHDLEFYRIQVDPGEEFYIKTKADYYQNHIQIELKK